jgi:hypothetical protein
VRGRVAKALSYMASANHHLICGEPNSTMTQVVVWAKLRAITIARW